jgi:hypothetical protein
MPGVSLHSKSGVVYYNNPKTYTTNLGKIAWTDDVITNKDVHAFIEAFVAGRLELLEISNPILRLQIPSFFFKQLPNPRILTITLLKIICNQIICRDNEILWSKVEMLLIEGTFMTLGRNSM